MKLFLSVLAGLLCQVSFSQNTEKYFYYTQDFYYDTTMYWSEYSHYYVHSNDKDSLVTLQADVKPTAKAFQNYIVKADSVYIRYGKKKQSLKALPTDTMFNGNKKNFLCYLGERTITIKGQAYNTYYFYEAYDPLVQDGIPQNFTTYIDKITLLPIIKIEHSYPQYWNKSNYAVQYTFNKAVAIPIHFNGANEYVIYQDIPEKWSLWQKAALAKDLHAINVSKKQFACITKGLEKNVTFYDYALFTPAVIAIINTCFGK